MVATVIRRMAPTLLYLDKDSDSYIQSASLAGVRRCAQSLRWNVVRVPPEDSKLDRLRALLDEHRPVAGCIVECSGGRRDLPPRVFGPVPVVYMHADPSLYGGRGIRVGYDDAAIAEAAFRELSAGLPAAFAVVPFTRSPRRRGWSLRRERAFAALASKSGKPFFRLPWKRETKEQRESRLARWLSTLPRHTAIFAVGDMTAIETAAAARLCHRSIPRELTLLGVDDDPVLCEASRPTLSSIQIDHELAGYVAARILAGTLTALPKAANDGALRANDILSSLPTKVTRHSGEAASHCASGTSSLTRTDGDNGIAEVAIGPLLALRRESTGGRGRHELRILEAVETIRREACDGLTAADLAARFPGSRSLFQLRFREAMGHSVLDEILHVRLEKALALLARTDTAIGAIPALCGFRTDRALDFLFHSRFGMSMRDWRKRNGRVRL